MGKAARQQLPTIALPMSGRQRLIAYTAMLIFGLPAVLLALIGGEVWPFLDYRMYAEAKLSPTIDWLELVGQTATNTEVRLDDERYFAPFDPTDLLTALEALDGQPPTSSFRAESALKELLTLYEKRRLAGAHPGPALMSLELYRIQWTSQPGLLNYEQPDFRRRLHAVSHQVPTP